MCKLGFGKHVWDLQDGDLFNILKYCKRRQLLGEGINTDYGLVYVAENAYIISISLTKISVVFLYLRLFEREPKFRLAAYVTIGVIATTLIILSSLFIFTCRPVTFFWNRDIPGGTCLDIKGLAFASGAMSIVQDMVILVLPLPVILKLNMDRKKKLGICFMLTLGSA